MESAIETLGRIDSEIIETDAIYKELLDKIVLAKRSLKQARRDTTFQVAVETDIKNEIDDLRKECEALDKSRIFLVAEQDRLFKQAASEQQKYDSLHNQITRLEKESTKLQSQVTKSEKRLESTNKRDKELRQAIAERQLQTQEAAAAVKSKKDELNKEIKYLQQVHPKLPTPKASKEKPYFKI